MRIFHLLVLMLLTLTVVGCGTTGGFSDEVGTLGKNASQQSELELTSDSAKDDYLLGQGDTIGIQVFDEPDLTITTVVGGSGSINYSYLGDIQVAGKSAVQLEEHIASLLKEGYLVKPSVNVTIVQYRPFYINGEVRSPGSYPYEPGLTLDKAIALAGGLTDRASTRKMFVIKGNDESGEGVRVSLNSRVAPGDIITINEGFF